LCLVDENAFEAIYLASRMGIVSWESRTEKTHTWVEVARSVAGQVARDAAIVVGVEEAAASE
jgi:hypothetical protein